MRTSLITPLLAGGILALPAAAQTTLISFESFDYIGGINLGGETGGTGWGGVWWSGMNLDDAMIVTPGFDAIGNKMQTVNQDMGSFRVPDTSLHFDVIDSMERFGIDGSSIWVSFTAQRMPGSTDQYGGFSFNELLVAEKLFIGEPYQTGLWGIDQPGGTPVTIPGTDPNQMTRFVTRTDHLPGQERLRVWLDPSVPHPTTPADIDVMVDDFVWNEIRLQSGQNGGGMTGYWFDELVIEKEGGSFTMIGTPYCGPAQPNSSGSGGVISALGVDFAGGQPLTLTASQLPMNQFGYFLAGQNQGFVPNAGGSQGTLCLSLPIGRFANMIQNSGTMGEMSISVDTDVMPLTPNVAVMSGETWNFQCWFRDVNPATTSNFTDGVSILFQ